LNLIRQSFLVASLSMACIASVQSARPTSTITSTSETKTAVPHVLAPISWGEDNEWSLQIGGMQRVRYERRDDYDMDKGIGDNDNFGLVRSQINADLVYRNVARAFIEVLDARTIGTRVDYQQEAYAHVQQAWLELREDRPNPWSIRVGRQELSLGEHLLVDSSPTWGNLPHVHEGVRIMRETPDWDMSMFLVQPTSSKKAYEGGTTSDANHRVDGQWFYGIYPTFKFLRPHEFDVYFLGLSDDGTHRNVPAPPKSEDGTVGTSDRYTVGTRWRGPISKTDRGTLAYGVEGGYQFGHQSSDKVQAYFLHTDLSYQWNAPWKPKVSLVGNLASGDRRMGDGETNTFQPPFGTVHTPYGIVDFARLQNLRHIGIETSFQPNEKLTIEPGIHQFWLDSRTDSWYNSGGSSLARDKTGQSGRDLGYEIDIVAKYKMNKFTTLEAGGAHFLAGRYADKNGRSDAASYLYLQYVLKF